MMKNKIEFKLTVLDADDVRAAAPTVVRAAELIQSAFEIADAGDVDQPEKPYVRPGGKAGERESGRLITMPAFVGSDMRVLGLKAITSHVKNPDRHGIPRAAALTLLFDPDNGRPTVVMEGAYLSALRTGATALFALRHLMVYGARCAAVLGAGVVSREVLRGLSSIEGLCEVAVFDVVPEAAERLVAWARAELGLLAHVATSAQLALEGAQAVIAATTAPVPYLKSDWFAPGCVYVALSLVDAEPNFMVEADQLVVDDWLQSSREGKPLEAMARSGRILESDAVTFVDLASGRFTRRQDRDRIYVNPMGVALEDLAVAKATWDRAKELGLGVQLDWS